MNKTKILLLFILMVMFFISTNGNVLAEDDFTLKIGIMPAVDSAPILLALERGYYQELNLDLKIDVYTNAVNRQSALQTGELDGAMTDLIAFVNNVKNGFLVKITTSTDGSFPVLVKKNFEEKEIIDIGMMEISVANFLSEQYLKEQYKMNKIFIPAIPARLEMVKSGKLDMAIIPEPLASMGELAGLEKRIYKNIYDFTPEAMIFTDTAIKNKSEAITRFHQAYNKAVLDIQKDNNLAKDVLINSLKLNPEIKELITLPDYHLARVFTESYLNHVISWVAEKQNEEITLSYKNMVEEKFIKND
ncbi:MAG: ABC transporter substrate-binding protein [Halanaerobiales bacterium]|nr:ABC transporter substrate-binding protein [Halanaerobiales bacterium]